MRWKNGLKNTFKYLYITLSVLNINAFSTISIQMFIKNH